MRLLRIQIANAHSPEARDIAFMLGYRNGSYDAMIMHHSWPGDSESATAFEKVAQAKVSRIDFGWRPNYEGNRRPGGKLLSRLRFIAARRPLLKAARGYDPDVIDACQQKWDCLAASYLAHRLRKPLILHLHYAVGPWLGNHTLKTLLTCDHVVTVADFIRDQAVAYGVPPERVTTIHNPMKLPPAPSSGATEAVRAELGIPLNAQVIGIAARLVPEKGQSDTIEAFARIAEAHPDAYLLIVGEGASRSSLEAKAAQSGAGRRIIFAGYRNDVPRLLQAMDIFAHPSRNEAFGLAVAEASAAGLPVVAYRDGGVPELVVQGETGLLAPAGDIGRLSECLSSLLSDPEAAKTMGAAGRLRIATHFDPESRGRAFADIVSSVVKGAES